MKLTYHRRGDYLYPNLVLKTDETLVVGKYGLLRKSYLKAYNSNLYQSMLATGKLDHHLAEVDRAAQERVDRAVDHLVKAFPPPEKEVDPLGWAAHMNNLTTMAEESVLRELIYA